MTATAALPSDERLNSTSRRTRVIRRPEVGAFGAALAVLVFFAVVAEQFLTAEGVGTWLNSASRFGIMAVAVALLMIGGEFDLSAGVMTGATGLFVGVVTTGYGLNIWLAVVVALVVALGIGALNAVIVMRTGLPSFIVTLGTFFVLQGLDLALVKLVYGQVAIQGLRDVPYYGSVQPWFGGSLSIGNARIAVSVLWALLVIALATYILLRTRAGNWIFAVGGAQISARQTGVPVLRTKIGLFMGTAGAGWLVGMISLFQSSTAQSSTGVGDEFIYIICAVVGGCLLTGGYGSAVGAALGALIYGMTRQGVVYAGWDSNWLYVFLGVMLLVAVLINNWIRTKAALAK
ncbi:MAG: ABC transporter permease [Geodermatophilaceae bacterium]|nr:ABC transporter permease [Geodermatophilaceae bacterium]